MAVSGGLDVDLPRPAGMGRIRTSSCITGPSTSMPTRSARRSTRISGSCARISVAASTPRRRAGRRARGPGRRPWITTPGRVPTREGRGADRGSFPGAEGIRLARLDGLSFVRGDFHSDHFWSLVHHCRSGGVADHARPVPPKSSDIWYDLVVGPVAAVWRTRLMIANADQYSFPHEAGRSGSEPACEARRSGSKRSSEARSGRTI